MPQPLVVTNHPWLSEDTPLLFTCGYSFTLGHLWILFHQWSPVDTLPLGYLWILLHPWPPVDILPLLVTCGYSSTVGHLWILFHQWSPVDILPLLVTCGYFSTFDWTTLNMLAVLVTQRPAAARSYYALHRLGFRLPGAPNTPILGGVASMTT